MSGIERTERPCYPYLGVLPNLIEGSVLPASEYPYIYRQGRVPGTREIVAHPNYIVVYEIRAHHIEIMGVLHTRQEYP